MADVGGGTVARSRAILDQPELNIAIFAFLLNYPWEFLQIPLYAMPLDRLPSEVIRICSIAAVGDAVIMLVSYWAVVLFARSRWWILRPIARQILGFIAVGVFITIAIEHLATQSDHPLWSWRYARSMPVAPVVGTGLLPLMQWLILPPLALWFIARQLDHLWRPTSAGGLSDRRQSPGIEPATR
ncbi:MAG: hypothetical protein M3Q08_09765 [Pseudomonadota bacterium]|nr:hypothetical protein [Pseudomonadota bacterium]